MIARFSLAAAALVAGLVGTMAREQYPAEDRYYPYDAAKLRGCDDPNVLQVLMARFANTQVDYWKSDLQIVSFSAIRTTDFRPNGVDIVPRRYCRGTVTLNNNHTSPVYYVLTQDAGMTGQAYGLQFCVQAYDRNWASGPDCRAMRP